MIEDFVTFEIAKKLKEKGYPQIEKSNLAMYDVDGEQLCELCSLESFNDTDYACPTISQVLKWLREEEKLHIEPCILADADTDTDGNVINKYTYWSFCVTSIETGNMIYFEYERIDDKRFNSFELAALAGIEYVLDKMI